MSPTEIRPLARPDVPAVVEMAHALAAHHGDQATLTEDILRRDALGETPWITVLVAHARDGPVGYAALCPLVQVQFGVRGMDMHHLFVSPDMRGRGVGRALIDASIAACKAAGCRYLMVGTHPDNARAAAFYETAGFDPVPPPGPRFRIKWDVV